MKLAWSLTDKTYTRDSFSHQNGELTETYIQHKIETCMEKAITLCIQYMANTRPKFSIMSGGGGKGKKKANLENVFMTFKMQCITF